MQKTKVASALAVALGSEIVTRIIICRHGNTFEPWEEPTRAGSQTDLDLVEKDRATAAGLYINSKDYKVSSIYSAPLKRTRQTAECISEVLGLDSAGTIIDESFVEIFYGPDENKTEPEVMARLGNGDLEKGKAVIDAWNADATVPDGWDVDVDACINTWHNVAAKADAEHTGETIVVVSSNGIIRFAPYITGDFEGFASQYDIKVTTGGVCVFEKRPQDKNWTCVAWNVKCKKLHDAGEF